MLAPSRTQVTIKIRTKSKKIKKNRKKSLFDPGRHFPVPYIICLDKTQQPPLQCRFRGGQTMAEAVESLSSVKWAGLAITRGVDRATAAPRRAALAPCDRWITDRVSPTGLAVDRRASLLAQLLGSCAAWAVSECNCFPILAQLLETDLPLKGQIFHIEAENRLFCRPREAKKLHFK